MFIKFINKKIQQKLKARERALAWKTSNANAPSDDGSLQPKDIMSRTPFIRMCSNKVDDFKYKSFYQEQEREGNILIQGGEFDEKGKMKFGIQNLYKTGLAGVKPIAGIKNIEVSYKNSYKALREATVNWVVGSIDDLDTLTPYFLTPGKSVALDWGWVTSKDESIQQQFAKNDKGAVGPFIFKEGDKYKVDQSLFDNPQSKIHRIAGDYDAIGGVISNFEYTLRPDGGFDCVTTISAVGANVFDIPVNVNGGDLDVVSVDSTEEDSSGNQKSRKVIYAYDSLINTMINLRDIIVYQLFGYTGSRKSRGDQIDDFTGNMDENLGGNIFTAVGLGARSDLSSRMTSIIAGQKSKLSRAHADNPQEPNVILFANRNFKKHKEEIFVRWGWFEDQVLNRYTAFRLNNQDDKIKMTIRSIDTMVHMSGEKQGEPVSWRDIDVDERKKSGIPEELLQENVKVSTKIRNTNVLKANDIMHSYIWDYLPSKEELEGSEDDDFNAFVEVLTSIKNDEIYDPEAVLDLDGSNSDKAKFFAKNKFTVDGSENKEGYLRNIWVNVKEIQKGFGITQIEANEKNESSVVPTATVTKALTKILKGINNNFNDPWDFEIVLDAHDSTNLKIVDKNLSGLKKPGFTKFEENSHKVSDTGIYKFPSYKIGSIVKSQTLSFKIPDSFANTVLWGSNSEYSGQSYNSSVPYPGLLKIFANDRWKDHSDDAFFGKGGVSKPNYSSSGSVRIKNVGSYKAKANSILVTGDSIGNSRLGNAFKVYTDQPWFKTWVPGKRVLTNEQAMANKKLIEPVLFINPDGTVGKKQLHYIIKKGTTIPYATAVELGLAEKINKRSKSDRIQSGQNRGGSIYQHNITPTAEPPKNFELKKDAEFEVTNDATEMKRITTGVFNDDEELIKENTDYRGVGNVGLYTFNSETGDVKLNTEVRNLIRGKLSGQTARETIDSLLPAELTLEVDGIGGIIPGDVLHTDYIQPRYNIEFHKKDNPDEKLGPLVYFQAMGISQKVDSSGWTTEIQSVMRFNSNTQDEEADVTNIYIPQSLFEPPRYDYENNESYKFRGLDNEIENFNPIVDPDLGLSQDEFEKLVRDNPGETIGISKQIIPAKERIKPVHADYAEALSKKPDEEFSRKKYLESLGRTKVIDITDRELNPSNIPVEKGKMNQSTPVQIQGELTSYHIVKPNETLSGIGKLYSIPWRKIAEWNNIPAPKYSIKINQKLSLFEPDETVDKDVVVNPDGSTLNINIDNPMDVDILRKIQNEISDSNSLFNSATSLNQSSPLVYGPEGPTTMHNQMDLLFGIKPNEKSVEDKKDKRKKIAKAEQKKKETGVLIVPQTPLPADFEGEPRFKVYYRLNRFEISFDETAETIEQQKILGDVKNVWEWFNNKETSDDDLVAVLTVAKDKIENYKKDLRKLKKEWEEQKTQQKN